MVSTRHAGETAAGAVLDAVLNDIRQAAMEESAGAAGHPSGRSVDDIVLPGLPVLSEGATIGAGRHDFTFVEFLALSDRAFVEAAYRAVLGRPADAEGLDRRLAALKAGRTSRARILVALLRSSERAERNGSSTPRITISGLALRFVLDTVRRVPVVGTLLSPVLAALAWPQDRAALDARLAALEAHNAALAERTETGFLGLRRLVRETCVSGHAAQ